MAQYIYTMNKVSKIVPPKREILKDISLSFFPGAKIGVLGLNGAGKSTLLKIMAGVDTEYNGEARAQAGIKIGYLAQEPQLDPAKDVRGNVEDGVREALDALARLDEIYGEYALPDADFDKLAAEQGKMEDIIQAWDAHNLNNQLEKAADALRLPAWDADVSKLSGGEKRRVALCRLLLSKPDMLLLDEPTNHLDVLNVAWITEYLQKTSATSIIVSHDSQFLNNVCTDILHLNRFKIKRYPGNLDAFVKRVPEARAYVELNSGEDYSFKLPNPPLLDGVKTKEKSLVKMRDVVFQYPNTPAPQLRGITMQLSLSSRVAVLGPNGSGKSTLMHTMAGLDSATSGSAFIGDTDMSALNDKDITALRRDRLGFIFQSFNLVPTLTAAENITLPTDIAGKDVDKQWFEEVTRRLGLAERLEHRPAELSGGQQQRVACARALVSRPEIIFGDEPTGNLDSNSSAEVLDILRTAVDKDNQTVVIVTHDAKAASYADRVVFLADGKLVNELHNPTMEAIHQVMAEIEG